MIYVYDVDRVGGVMMHFATLKGEEGSISYSPVIYPQALFRAQEAMHKRMGHTLTLEIDNELGTVWSVRIGRGDFNLLLAMLTEVGNDMLDTLERGNHARKARNN
jgi:hypothetical protein